MKREEENERKKRWSLRTAKEQQTVSQTQLFIPSHLVVGKKKKGQRGTALSQDARRWGKNNSMECKQFFQRLSVALQRGNAAIIVNRDDDRA